MVKKREKFPEEGELIVAQVDNIQKMYVYVRLEDYEGLPRDRGRALGMVHISELSNAWVRNITDFMKINQRVVLRVLRVNSHKGHIDLSLRRVNDEQKIYKMNEWKFELKAENLLKIFGKLVGATLEEVYNDIGNPLLDIFGDIHEAFDEIKRNGKSELDSLDISDEWKESFFEFIDSNIELNKVEINGTFEIVVYEGEGVKIVKKVIENAKKVKTNNLADFSFHYIGAPFYNFKISANNYQDAEKYLKKVINSAKKTIKLYNGQVEFFRD
ncbi:MAG: translation initiation factor IF-2 subunit alpha [Promethearchaeota archaeon]